MLIISFYFVSIKFVAPKNFSIRKIVKGYIGNLSKALKWIKELVSFKMNTCKLYSKAIVNDEMVAESEFMATIIDKDF